MFCIFRHLGNALAWDVCSNLFLIFSFVELQSFSSIVSTQPILNPLKIKVYEISLVWITVTFSVHVEANSCGFAQDVFCSIFCYARTIEVLMQIHIAGPSLWSEALEISFLHALTPVSTLVCHLELGWTPSQVSPGIITGQRRRVVTSCLKHSHSFWKVRDQSNKIK